MLLTPSPSHKLHTFLDPCPLSSVTYFMDGPSLKILMIVATLFTQCESMKSFLGFLLAKSQIQVLRAFFSIQITCFTIYTECVAFVHQQPIHCFLLPG